MKNVQDIYPLSPLQEGMLFHTVAEPGSGLYVDQVSAQLAGDLDPAAFEAAWGRLLARHAALRTAFLWDGVDEPLQVVRETVDLSWEHEDWRAFGEDERGRRREERLREERARGFDPASAPLMRMTLARTGEHEWWWLWTFHHLLADGWSTAVLLRELFAEIARGAPAAGAARPPGDASPLPYREYIAWHARQDRTAAETFWREQLAGFRAPTRLPSFGADAAAPEGVRQREASVPAAATAAIRALARQHGLTLNTVVQGAWALLLSRLSRDEDVVFGMTTSGRPPELPGIETAVGLYINTLPLRVQVEPEASLIPWLKGMQARQLEIQRREFSPLAAVQRWSDVPAGDPLFESIVVFENYPAEDALVPEGLSLDVRDLRFDEQSNYPLALLCLPGDELRLIAVQDPRRLGDQLTETVLGLLVRVLEAFARDPGITLGRIPLSGDEDLRRLASWNDTDVASTRAGCIHEWIEETAAAHPDTVAVAAPDGDLTYAELDRRADALARILGRYGVGANVPVGLLVEPSAEMVVGILGILKAGGAYVPLDPSYPPGHVRYVLEDTEAPVLVTQEPLRERVPATAARIVTLGDDGPPDADDGDDADARTSVASAGAASAGAASAGADESSHAYVLHTSGTSGRPKGVPVTHANLVHSTEAREHVYGAPVGRFLLLSSFAFDSSIAGIFWTLVSGGTLVIPRPRLEQDLRGMLDLVRDKGITHTLCLPTLYSLILRDAAPEDLGSLRTVIVAGEACAASVVQDHHRFLPGARLFNEYGPTEATVWSTVHELTPEDTGDPVSIGRPIPRMRAYVLDSARNPLPAGVPGELWMAGAGITGGYRNLPELTADRFVTLEVGGREERAYGTGDLVAWRPDGTLLFLGRADSQVKLRGHRIEPAGIEAVLREHPAVGEAAVAVRGAPERLVAYVVAKAGGEPDFALLGDHLRDALPDFLVPDHFLSLEALPRTSSGKIDHRALPDPEPPAGASRERVAPRNDVERTLVEIWREVLGVEEVGMHDDYFLLGGDSILSIQIVSRVRAAGLRIEPRHVLERPTIAQLAESVRLAPDAAPHRAPVTGDVPLSPIQAWFLGRELAAPHHWNQSALFEVPAEIDVDRLRRALASLTARHDQLRARFERGADGAWRQIVAPAEEVEIPLAEAQLGGEPGPARDAEQERHLLAAQSRLDLARAPLARAALLRRGAAEPALFLFAVHHLIVDAVSWGILIEDLEVAYAQAAGGGEPELPERTVSFRAWAAAVRQDAERDDAAVPWLRLLREDAADLPVDGEAASPAVPATSPAATEADACTVRRELPADLTQAVLTTANETYRTRAGELLLAALTLAVGTSGGPASLRLFREGHGRDGDLDVSRTVGWFTSVIPVALRLAAPADAGAAIRAAKEQLRAVPERSQGYGALRWIEASGEMSRSADPLVLFNYLGRAPAPAQGAVFRRISGAESTSRDPRNERSHPLEINVIVRGDRFVVDWIHTGSSHRGETIGKWADRFEAELARLARHCGEATGRFTASDFPEAGLDEDDLGKLTKRLGGS